MADDAKRTSSVRSNLYSDSSGHTIKDYPGEIEGEYLLGIDKAGGWYYNPVSKGIRNYQLIGGEDGSPLELKLEFSMDEKEVEESFSDVSDLVQDLVDKTRLGHSLVLSAKLANNTYFSKPQAKVYALRDVYGVGRKQTARILNKSANTVDNQRTSAKKKAEQAKEFVRIVRDYSPDNEVV